MVNADQSPDNDAGGTTRPRVNYVHIYLLSAVMIVAGLSVISLRVAVVLGTLLLPALAIVTGMVSRVEAWRPVLLRVWPLTAVIVALLFLMPGHLIYRLATMPDATFKRLVLNPIPAGVANLEKRESRGLENWVSLTFDADTKTAGDILASRPFQLQATQRAELRQRAGQINLGDALVYEADYPADDIRFTAIISRGTSRVCVLYEHY